MRTLCGATRPTDWKPRPSIRRPNGSSRPSAQQAGVFKELSLQTTIAEETADHNETEIETTGTTFADLGLSEMTVKALDRAGFKSPSPVQARLIPAADSRAGHANLRRV